MVSVCQPPDDMQPIRDFPALFTIIARRLIGVNIETTGCDQIAAAFPRTV